MDAASSIAGPTGLKAVDNPVDPGMLSFSSVEDDGKRRSAEADAECREILNDAGVNWIEPVVQAWARCIKLDSARITFQQSPLVYLPAQRVKTFRRPAAGSHNHRVVFCDSDNTAYKIIKLDDFKNIDFQTCAIREYFVLKEITAARTSLLLQLEGIFINQDMLMLCFKQYQVASEVFVELDTEEGSQTRRSDLLTKMVQALVNLHTDHKLIHLAVNPTNFLVCKDSHSIFLADF